MDRSEARAVAQEAFAQLAELMTLPGERGALRVGRCQRHGPARWTCRGRVQARAVRCFGKLAIAEQADAYVIWFRGLACGRHRRT